MTNEMLSGYAVGLSLMNSYDIDSYYLYCKGCLAKNICGGIVGSISSENNLSSFEARSNCLDVQVYGDNNYATVSFTNKIDLTNFSKLCISYEGNSTMSVTTELGIAHGTRTESYLAVMTDNTIVAKLNLSADSSVTSSLNVSDLIGEYSIVIHVGDLTPSKGLQKTLSFLINSIFLMN